MRIAFIGGGHMATGLIGALRARGVSAAAITVADPDSARTEALARDYGVRATRDTAAAAHDADSIVIAVKPEHVRAAAAGIRNVMRWAKMLPEPYEPIREVPVLDLGYPVRRMQHPRVSQSCIVHHLVQPGQRVRRGDVVARAVDIFGRPIEGNGLLRTEFDGFVLGLYPNLAHYPNEAVMGLAVRDDSSLVQQISRA